MEFVDENNYSYNEVVNAHFTLTFQTLTLTDLTDFSILFGLIALLLKATYRYNAFQSNL